MNGQQPPFQTRNREMKRQSVSGKINHQEGEGSSSSYDRPEFQPANPPPVRKRNKKNKHRSLLGLIALLTFTVGMMVDGTSSAEKDTLQSTGVVDGAIAGTVFFDSDEGIDLKPKDYELTMKKGTQTSRMLIWDFAAEDGDIVEVRVNGKTINPRVHLLNKPKAIEIPVPAKVEIIGVKDGVGGITYGVKFPGNVSNRAYFNVAPEGSSNTYTVLEP